MSDTEEIAFLLVFLLATGLLAAFIYWLVRQTTHGNRKLLSELADALAGKFADDLPAELQADLADSYLMQITRCRRHAVAFDDAGLRFTLFEAEMQTAPEALPVVMTALCTSGFEQALPDFLWRPGKPNDTSRWAQFLGKPPPPAGLQPIPLESAPSVQLFGNDVPALGKLLGGSVRRRLVEDKAILESRGQHLLYYRPQEQLTPTTANVAARMAELRALLNEMGLQAPAAARGYPLSSHSSKETP
ncbi:MAG: hypothetical protein DWQ37_12845 [Planctomycetota bacterium]|nr:MAG: hypothetical protein DWQ37_12845 [Planctomycetota bacterium]